MSGAHVPDVHVAKKIKCENPFPNWKPITKISYIELDIIVSRLVYILEFQQEFRVNLRKIFGKSWVSFRRLTQKITLFWVNLVYALGKCSVG